MQHLLNLIKNHDADMLNNTLQNLSETEIEMYLNRDMKEEQKPRFHYRHCKTALKEMVPIIFEAIILGYFDLVKILHRNGASFCVTDTHGWNILHYLIVLSYKQPNYESSAARLFNKLNVIIGTNDFINLLKEEDLEGLRPLEMALHYGCLQLFDVIINMPDIYLAKVEEKGRLQYLWYDITEYEQCGCQSNRRSRCPMVILSNLDSNSLKDPKNLQILRNGMLNKWAASKITSNIPMIVLWFLIRISIFIGFYMMFTSNFAAPLQQDIEYLYLYLQNLGFTINGQEDVEQAIYIISESANFTDSIRMRTKMLYELALRELDTYTCFKADWLGMTYDSGTNLGYLLLFFSLLSIGFDIFEKIVDFLQDRNRWNNCFAQSKKVVVSTNYYRRCQFLFALLGTVWCYVYIMEPTNEFIKYGIIPTCYVSVWTILYFLQMLPAVGNFVNSIQQMLRIMFQFVVIYAFILMPYPFAFYILLRSIYGCTGPGFEDPLEAFYTIFKIMLNMEDFSSYKELTDLKPTYLLHVIYVFTVAILLVNFLIALLSTSVGEVVEAGDVIMMLQRLSVVTVVEKRMSWIVPFFYRCMHRFLYTCRGGRIYLVISRFSTVPNFENALDTDCQLARIET